MTGRHGRGIAPLKENLAAAMLDVVLGEEPPGLAWDVGPIEFEPDGTVR